MDSSKLRKLVSKAPAKPGIYIFTGTDGKKLYIGKASNLKVRLGSYLTTKDARISKMISLAINMKTLETGSDIEALITESLYIKKFKPEFNIILRDDKQFFYVGFSNDKFPRIFITHQPFDYAERKRRVVLSVPKDNRPASLGADPTKYIGPFTDGTALKTTLRHLRRIFPYCTCKKLHNNYCLNYHIGKCYGFCCLKNNPNQNLKVSKIYLKNISAVRDILTGKKTLLFKNLEKEMVSFGKKEEFEKAIELKKRLDKIKRVFENVKIIQNSEFKLQNSENKNNGNSRLQRLAKVIGLNQWPNRIEGYDISNIQGKYAVGVMVVFSDGRPDKNEYRKFKIYTKHSPDDVYMLKEVLERRFDHPEWPMPDLILIDGGKAQLNATMKTLQRSGLKNKELRIIALTKNKRHRGEKIYIAQNNSTHRRTIPLTQLREDLKNLLLQIDAEAHRFAISYYRKLHRSSVEKRGG